MEFKKVINSKSKVWEHFSKNVQNERAKCNSCGDILRITGGSTKSLIGHLKNKHNTKFESSIKQKSTNVHDKVKVNIFQKAKRSKYQEHLDKVLEISDTEDIDVNLDESIDLGPNITISQDQFIEHEKRKKSKS